MRVVKDLSWESGPAKFFLVCWKPKKPKYKDLSRREGKKEKRIYLSHL